MKRWWSKLEYSKRELSHSNPDVRVNAEVKRMILIIILFGFLGLGFYAIVKKDYSIKPTRFILEILYGPKK